jgi:4-amino-4-deoxy-L-arabinose transferase-like glycosyltransferase
MVITKNELKIFLTFFVIYFVFIYWYGYNENSSFDLTRAIVDEGRLEIDSYYNNTRDRSVYNSHYYSNKAIGAPLQAVPIYASWKYVYYNLFPQSFIESNKPSLDFTTFMESNNMKFIHYNNPGIFIKISMILVTSLTSSLFSALTVLLIYKISEYFTNNKKHRFLLVTIYGFGTLAFPYATVFFSISTITFFSFFAFHFIFKSKNEKIKNKYIFLTGLLSGIAIITEHMSLLLILFLLIYILTIVQRKKLIILFLMGNFLALLPLFAYNFYIFSSPFDSVYKYYDPITVRNYDIWIASKNTFGFNLSFEPFRILRLLIFPFVGLFFYYPILILSLFGLFWMNKKYKIEKFFIIFLFFSLVILVSMFFYWWGGAIGPRFLLIAIPFLVIPIVYTFKKINIKIISILLIFSILVNLLSTVSWTHIIFSVMGRWGSMMDLEYANKVNSFEILANPLFEKNIYYFIETGPTSRLIESFIIGNNFLDIRDFEHMTNVGILNIKLFTSPFGFVLTKVSFITTLVVLIVILLIWKRDLGKFIIKHKYLFTILFLLLILYFFDINDLIYEKQWYYEETYNGVSYRWMSDNATLILFSPKEEKVKLQFDGWAFHSNRTLNLYLNDGFIASFKVMANESRSYTSSFFELKGGENILRFDVVGLCDVPAYVGGLWRGWESDYRCLSLLFLDIRKLTIEDLIKIGIVYENNWYLEESDNLGKFRWMSDDANVSIYSESNKQVNLELGIKSYHKNRTLQIYSNDNLIESFVVNTNWNNASVDLDLDEGENIIRFHSVEGCDAPSEVENSSDNRCLSFAFRDILVNK